MRIALLGTGFAQAHAAVYAARTDVDEVTVFGRTTEKLDKIAAQFGFATTTDLDAVFTDSSVNLIDVCLPTALHAETAIRAMRSGKDVLIELPLATTIEDAHRIIDTQQATGRQAFVDMFSRFLPANQYLATVVADRRYGELKTLEIEGRSALLWEGYDLNLESLAMDMMHADFDLATQLLGRPDTVHVAGVDGPGGRGAAADVLLGYPHATIRCSSSSLMPRPYGMRGGYRATFTGAVLERSTHAGPTGQGSSVLTEITDTGQRVIDLPTAGPYAEMIDHVLACLTGQADNHIDPASALPALELTLDVHNRLQHLKASQ
jgi:predicted dehydrogenase